MSETKENWTNKDHKIYDDNIIAALATTAKTASRITQKLNAHDRLKEMLEKLVGASHGAMKTDANWWEDLQAAIDESSELLEELK